MRGDIDELETTLDKVFASLERNVARRSSADATASLTGLRVVKADIARARAQADDLLVRLESLEERLISEPDTGREDHVVAS